MDIAAVHSGKNSHKMAHDYFCKKNGAKKITILGFLRQKASMSLYEFL